LRFRGEPIPPSIEEMAADRLPHILERQTSGPFLLAANAGNGQTAPVMDWNESLRISIT
jgi:oxalate---CoA ligase